MTRPCPVLARHGMALALACAGPVPRAQVLRLLLEGDAYALSQRDLDRLHGWLHALLFAGGDPEDDEQIAMWLAALEQEAAA